MVEQARRNGARLIVIDPYRTRTAALADWHIAIRPGTDAALALGMMHVILSEGLEDRAYIAEMTHGFERLAERVREYTPERVAAWTGMTAAEVEQLAREYATTRPAAMRLNYGVQRCENGGTAVRAIAMLPALTGAWKYRGGGGQLSTSGAFAWNKKALERPDLALASPLGRLARVVNMSALGQALTELGQSREQGTRDQGAERPGGPCAVCLQLESRRGRAESQRSVPRPGARRSVHRGARAVLYRHHRLRRLHSARDHVPRAHRRSGRLRPLLCAALEAGH